VVVPGAVVGLCAEASMDMRDPRPGLCSLWATDPWWRGFVGCWFLQRVAPRRGTVSVTAAHVSAACFGLLSHVVVVGGVLCWVRLSVLLL
jgi:hypothetical protein